MSFELKPPEDLPVRISTISVLSYILQKEGINFRPYAREILKKLHKDFEIMVFSTSSKTEANRAMDYLDPEKRYIQYSS